MQEIKLIRYADNELKSPEEYIGTLAVNNDGVYNICRDYDDVVKGAQWFGNRPVRAVVVDIVDEPAKEGDVIFTECPNVELSKKVFEIKQINVAKEIVYLRNVETNKEIITTKYILDSYRFVRFAHKEEIEKIVNMQTLDIFNFTKTESDVYKRINDIAGNLTNKNKQSGFFDLPKDKTCRHIEHNPPSFMHIPQGKGYRHVCPGCGTVQEIIPTQISF